MSATGAPRRHRARTAVIGAVAAASVLSGCVGTGKVARADELGPMPEGLHVVADVETGCRPGESGFQYRWVVVAGTDDLTPMSPLLTALRDNGFYHSIGLVEDLPWISVGYQHKDFPLRAELGPLSRYLARPAPFQGPDPASLPAEVRAHPEGHVLIALRPTDFSCSTPL